MAEGPPAPDAPDPDALDPDALDPDLAETLRRAREQRRDLARRDHVFFFQYYFAADLAQESPAFHYELMDLAARHEGPEWANRRGLVVAVPRGHAKSTIITKIMTAWQFIAHRKRFCVIFSDTAGQATTFAAEIRGVFTDNERIREDFGELAGFHHGYRWTQDDFDLVETDENGTVVWLTKVMARSNGASTRGLLARGHRPDLVVCHEVGTPMLHDGQWLPVEEHPTAQLHMRDGCAVRVWGLPFAENVTPEHRFWTRRVSWRVNRHGTSYSTEDGWREASDLASKKGVREATYVGLPIDMTNAPPPAIPCYGDGKYAGSPSLAVPPEFSDPEWWWLFGYWWGDGYLGSGFQMGVVVNEQDVATRLRVERLLTRANIHYRIGKQPGCVQILFSHRTLRTWLATWRSGMAQKCPPLWVEHLDRERQSALVQGYVAADGFIDHRDKSVRLTSVCLQGLLCLRRILMRLGIAATIRAGVAEGQCVIRGRVCRRQAKYDLRFRDGADTLGYPIADQSRRRVQRVFIADGYLWSGIRSVAACGERCFVPIQTADHTYVTAFARHHNCDDCENDDHVQTVDQRRKTSEWFHKVVVPAIDPLRGHLIVVGTILHFDSLLNTLLERERADGSKLYVTRRMQALDAAGAPLWPGRFSPALLADLREQMGPHAFACEYMNNPIDERTRRFRPEWVQCWRQSELSWFKEGHHWEGWRWRGERLRFYVGVDPAAEKKDRNDYFALVVLGYTPSGKKLVMWSLEDRLDFPDQVNQVLLAHRFFRPTGVAVEATAYQRVLPRQVLREEKVPIREVQHAGDKMARLTSMSADWYRGEVYFRAAEGEEGGEPDELDLFRVHESQVALYRQAMRYPEGGHDDLLDAFQNALAICGQGRAFFSDREGTPPAA